MPRLCKMQTKNYCFKFGILFLICIKDAIEEKKMKKRVF